jgi:hypothetical protein
MTNNHTKCNRPMAYSAEIGERIFDRLIEGQSVRAICTDVGMPNEDTLRRWLNHEEELHKICEAAFQLRADGVADQFYELLFGEPRPHQLELVRGRGVRIGDADNPRLARFRNDLRMWLMQLLLAKQPA